MNTIETESNTEAHDTTAIPARSEIAARLQRIEETCGYGPPLANAARRANGIRIRRVPTSIVDRVILLAERGEGVVAGIKLDPEEARGALAAAEDADAVAIAASMLARRATDQAIRLRAAVFRDVVGIRVALRGYTKTAQGEGFAEEDDELRALARQHAAAAKGRRTRAANARRSESEVSGNDPSAPSAP